MTCATCAHWVFVECDQFNERWGDCFNKDNQFKFIPHTWCPESFREKGRTLEDWNRLHTPIPVPLTKSTVLCKHYRVKE